MFVFRVLFTVLVLVTRVSFLGLLNYSIGLPALPAVIE